MSDQEKEMPRFDKGMIASDSENRSGKTVADLFIKCTQLRAENAELLDKLSKADHAHNLQGDAYWKLRSENDCLTKQIERAKEDAEARDGENEELKKQVALHAKSLGGEMLAKREELQGENDKLKQEVKGLEFLLERHEG